MSENDFGFRWLSPNPEDAAGRRMARYYADKVAKELESDSKNPDIIASITDDMRQLMHIVDSLSIGVAPVDFDNPSLMLGTKMLDEANRYVTAVQEFIPLENEPDIPGEGGWPES